MPYRAPVTILSEPLLDASDVAAMLKLPTKTVRQYALAANARRWLGDPRARASAPRSHPADRS